LAVLLAVFTRTRARARTLERATQLEAPLCEGANGFARPLVVVPLRRLDELARNALRFALAISDEVHAVQVIATRELDQDLPPSWSALVEEPCRRADLAVPSLAVLRSPFGAVI